MYSPRHYKTDREDLAREVIHQFGFATLISVVDGAPFISHLPVILDEERNVLISHCARANPHWKLFSANHSLTVIFNGPHGYISPAWYKPDPDNVPTWNYVALHITGCARIIEDENEAWVKMKALVEYFENKYKTGWSLPQDPNDRHKKDLQKGITVFEISMDKVESKFKLSQKQSAEDRDSVIKNLPLFMGESGSVLAEMMRKI